MAVEPFPFATLEELKARWPDFPTGADTHAAVLLEDASQFILDICAPAALAAPATRRRVVCAVVRRSMESAIPSGLTGLTESAGGVSVAMQASNPNGDFYLTKQEKISLGDNGKQKAFGGTIAGPDYAAHRPWCNLMFGAAYCSCGADIAGEPIYEAG